MSETPTRRARMREDALAEISHHALAQLEAGGVAAVSLNAIGRAMGMSGPALYRYYGSRDALLAALAEDCFHRLADALESTASRSGRRTPRNRLRALLQAYRAWGVAHPEEYRLALSSPHGSGAEGTVDAAQRSMRLLLRALSGCDEETPPRCAGELDRQLLAWARARSGEADHDPAVLRLGVLAWTRVHGIVMLELAQALESMGLDGALLVDAEVDALLRER